MVDGPRGVEINGCIKVAALTLAEKTRVAQICVVRNACCG